MSTPAGAVPTPRVGVLSFAHCHANFWSEVFAAYAAARTGQRQTIAS
jgi:hypothetical protein